MKLQQLRYINEIQRNGYNITSAAEKLFTSQPGISKQVALLESEIGIQIFERTGKHLSGTTEVGKQIIREAERMLEIEQRIKAISASIASPNQGQLNIYTTNAIANFLLPESVYYIMGKYPKVSIHLGTIESNYLYNENKLPTGPYDISIVASDVEQQKDLIALPAYKWSLCLIVPSDHHLATAKDITLAQLAREKLITYDRHATGRITLDKAFAQQGLEPNYVITAMDVSVIKEYVSHGVGVGIVASVATHSLNDRLTVRSLEGLIPDCNAWICYNQNSYLQKYMYDFIAKFAPHLTRSVIEEASQLSRAEQIKFFEDVQFMVYR